MLRNTHLPYLCVHVIDQHLMATTSVSFTHLRVYDEFACANSMLLN